MSRLEVSTSIREALGIRLSGTAATISHEATRRLVGALEMLDDEQLEAVLKVSRKAAELSSIEVNEGNHRNHDYPAMCREHTCVGEDVKKIKFYINFNYLKEVYALAKAIDQLPDGMTVRDAHESLAGVIIERFELDTAELVAAHLHVAHELTKDRRGYHPDMMLLVHTHPDKAKTISTLAIKGGHTPTNREVLDHHGIEPVLYEGVL